MWFLAVAATSILVVTILMTSPGAVGANSGGTVNNVRTKLDCTKIYEIQTIGITDGVSATDFIQPGDAYMPFSPFGCKVRLLSMTTTITPPPNQIPIESMDGINKYNFALTGDVYVAPTGEGVYVEAGGTIVSTLSGQPFVTTPGFSVIKRDAGRTPLPGVSMNLNIRVAVAYNCSDWSKPNDFCLPNFGVSGNGTFMKNRTCAPMMDDLKETFQVEVTDCTIQPIMNTWLEWSRCEMMNDTESCGANATKYRPGKDCYDDVTKSALPSEYCPYKVYHIRSCVKYCKEEHSWHPYLWNAFSPCELFKPDLQGNDSVCGNGFQNTTQNKCIAGPDGLQAEEINFCPPSGIHVRSCYIPCEPLAAIAEIEMTSDNTSTSLPFENQVFEDDAPLKIYGRFEPVNSMLYTDEMFKATTAKDQVSFFVFLNKFVYITEINANFPQSESGTVLTATHDFKLSTTIDGDQWEERIPNKALISEGVTYNPGLSFLLSGIEISFNNLTISTGSIAATKLEIKYHLPPQWADWGNWTGGCTDDNCQLTNSTWYRMRKCEHEGNEVDAQHCIGQFYEVQQCKCPSLYRWDLSAGSYNSCIPRDRNTVCGHGFEFSSPEICRYNHKDQVADNDYWRCGIKPIQARSCFKVCNESCTTTTPEVFPTETDKEGTLQIGTGEAVIIKWIKAQITETGDAGKEYSIGYQQKVGFYNILLTGTFDDAIAPEANVNVLAENGTIAYLFNSTVSSVALDLYVKYCAMPNYTEIEGNCSAVCGNGTRRHSFRCRDADDTTDFEDIYCDYIKKPDSFDTDCATGIVCYEYDDWSAYSECSGECGQGGNKKKTRGCLGDGLLVDKTLCIDSDSIKFNASGFFEDQSCYNSRNKCYKWGNWSEWKDVPTCGNGTQYMERECFEDSNTGDDPWTVTSNTTACDSLADLLPGIKRDEQLNITGVSCYRWTEWGEWSSPPLCDEATVSRKRSCEKHFIDSYELISDIQECVSLDRISSDQDSKLHQTDVPCAVGVSDWSAWGQCTRECNGGQLKRTRECVGDSDDCKLHTMIEELPCNEVPCKIDGFWSNYTDWTPCSVSCGNGTQQRQRMCTPPNQYGKPCSNYTGSTHQYQTRDCTAPKACAGFSMANKACTTFCTERGLTCGVGMRDLNETTLPTELGIVCKTLSAFTKDYHPSIVKDVQTGEVHCNGFQDIGVVNCDAGLNGTVEERVCNCINQDEETMGDWSRWGECSVTCGIGVYSRSRELVQTEAETKVYTQSGECTPIECPVHGAWSLWSGFNVCNVTCGSGYRKRWRTCDNPAPKHGGANCSGTNINMEQCGDPPICPINGHWSQWDNITDCTIPCKWDVHDSNETKSLKVRRRQCKNPVPQFGGDECEEKNGIGHLMEEECTNLPQCRTAVLDVHVEFVDEEYDSLLENINSATAKKIKDKILQNVKEVYKNHPHTNFNVDFFRIEFHDFKNGTGEGLVETKP